MGSNAVPLMRDIKQECAYLGIPDNSSSDIIPASKPTAPPLDDSPKKPKSI